MAKGIILISIIMMILIITIPIYSSTAMAKSYVRVIDAHGTDDVRGYIKDTEDTLTVIAEVVPDEDDITDFSESLVRYDGAGASPMDLYSTGAEFNKCPLMDDHYLCTFYGSTAGFSNPESIRVYLYDGALPLDGPNVVALDTSKKVYIDKLPPKIEINTGSNTIGSDGLSLDYTAVDYASSSYPNKCSGIQQIEFYSSQFGLIATIPDQGILSDPDDCTKTDDEFFNTIELGDEGEVELYAKVYDNVGRIGVSDIIIITIDLSAPTIDTGTFSIIDKLGGDASLVPPDMVEAGFKVSIAINITEEDLDLSSITLDLSVLNPVLGLTNPTDCETLPNNVHRCSWNDIQLDLSVDTNANLEFSAADNVGNPTTAFVPYTFDIDNTLPTVNDIMTAHRVDGIDYFGFDGIITVKIDAVGAGFQNANVFMDLSQINSGLSNKKADNCAETAVESDYDWNCNFSVTLGSGTEEGEKEIFVNDNSKDDFDKNIDSSLSIISRTVMVDKTKPIISNVAYSSDFPTAAEPLTVTFDVEEMNGIFASIDASAISADTLPKQAFCTEVDDNKFTCNVEVDNLVSVPTTGAIRILAQDYAGNEADPFEGPVTVYRHEGVELPPDCFAVSDIEPIPSRIDRKTATDIVMDVFVHVTLSSMCQDAEIIGMSADCSATNPQLSVTPTIMNEDSLDPFIRLQTPPGLGLISEDKFTVDCTLMLKERIGNTVYLLPEEERITTDIELYGSAMGEIEESLQKKLDNIGVELHKVEKDIKHYEKTIKTWGQWCKYSQIAGKINTAAQAIKSIIFGALTVWWYACVVTGWGSAACQAGVNKLWSGACIKFSYTHTTIEKYIWPSGYISPYVIGLLNKWACMIGFHCALCDWDTYLTIGISFAAEAIGDIYGDTTVGGEYEYDLNQLVEPDTTSTDQTPSLSDGSLFNLNGGDVTSSSDTYNLYDLSGTDTTSSSSSGLVDNRNFNTQLNEPPPLPTPVSYHLTTPSLGISGEVISVDSIGTDTVGTAKKEQTSLKSKIINTVKKGLTKITGRAAAPAAGDSPPIIPNPQIEGWMGGWYQKGEQTYTDAAGSWVFDPYKSIHYAKACRCLPAIVYNLRKDRQIKCMYRNCIMNHLEQGITTPACDVAYKERECLYVESAQFKRSGYRNFLETLWQTVLENWPALTASLGYLVLCSKYIATDGIADCAKANIEGTPLSGLIPVACGLYGALTTLREIEAVFGGKYSPENADYNPELEGEDYCASGGY